MNLYFNIACHVLTFLFKHRGELFSSQEIAKRLCVNPVQLRQVMRVLVKEGYVSAKKGKYGGYSAVKDSGELRLSVIFRLFRQVSLDPRIFTGQPDSDCLVARHMGAVMGSFAQAEYQQLEVFYAKYCIKHILTEILERESVNENL